MTLIDGLKAPLFSLISLLGGFLDCMRSLALNLSGYVLYLSSFRETSSCTGTGVRTLHILTLYIVHCTLYIVHCTWYIVHGTLYIVHFKKTKQNSFCFVGFQMWLPGEW